VNSFFFSFFSLLRSPTKTAHQKIKTRDEELTEDVAAGGAPVAV